MSYKLSDVVFEKDKYWVLRVKYGFEVYLTCLTHSTRIARVGFKDDNGLGRCKKFIDHHSKNYPKALNAK